MRNIFLLISILLITLNANAVTNLTLDGCRDLALQRNKQAQIDKENISAAEDLKKASVAKFFPKVSANGGYSWMEKNLFILPSSYSFSFGTMNPDGTFTFKDDAFQTQHFNYADFREAFPELDQQLSDWAANEYKEIRELSELDVHHVFVGQIGVVQPIFLGGKVVELYKIAKATENIAQLSANQHNDELIVSVDEAYWRVISVEQKYLLADRYCKMLRQVEENMSAAAEEGTVTKGDLLKVRVKLNEAEVSLAKATNGLTLSKMALCQIIGLPLDTDIHLDDSGLENLSVQDMQYIDMDNVLQRRNEIQMLQQAQEMADAGVKLTASTLMPNIVASANYIATSPNLFNGYRDNHQFRGTFQAGVVVNIPIAHADDIYQLKAAKHKAKTLDLQLEEAKEKIELQATQSQQQLQEANRKLAMAIANINNAEENLRMAQAAFDEGMLTSTELLGAQTAWLKAYSEKIDAAIEVRMYETYLKKNTGRL